MFFRGVAPLFVCLKFVIEPNVFERWFLIHCLHGGIIDQLVLASHDDHVVDV
jgi:hypothetical protein